MSYCDTCKHWTQFAVTIGSCAALTKSIAPHYRKDHTDYPLELRTAENQTFGEYRSLDELDPAKVLEAVTQSDFGCTLHEPVEARS